MENFDEDKESESESFIKEFDQLSKVVDKILYLLKTNDHPYLKFLLCEAQLRLYIYVDKNATKYFASVVNDIYIEHTHTFARFLNDYPQYIQVLLISSQSSLNI